MKLFRTTFVMLFLILITVFGVYSESLTLLINQKDGIQEKVKETTKLYEDCLLDCFFDYGMVVTNEPISMDSELTGVIQTAYDASSLGYIDYLAVFDFSLDAVTEKPQKVEWQLIRIKDYKKIANGTIKSNGTFNSIEESVQQLGVKTARIIWDNLNK